MASSPQRLKPWLVGLLSALAVAVVLAVGFWAYALVTAETAPAGDAISPGASPSDAAPSPSASTPVSPSPDAPAAHTVLLHDGVLRAELPASYVQSPDGTFTDGTATFGCWAWRDATIPTDGTQPAEIMSTWLAWWNSWGYSSADEVASFANVNGYADSEVWYVVFIYEDGGVYDFEVWEPHAYLIDGDVFIECSARVFSPADAPPVGWDEAFLRLVESVTIVDRPAILTNVWGTERGDY